MSTPQHDSDIRDVLERMLRDMDSLLDHVTDPRNDRTREVANQLALIMRNPPVTQHAPIAPPAMAQPAPLPTPDMLHTPHVGTLEPQYRPSMAENGLVTQIVAYIVPWEYQATVYNMLGHVRVKTRHMALILIVGAIGGIATGYIPIPRALREGMRELVIGRPVQCPAPDPNRQPTLHVPPPPPPHDVPQAPQYVPPPQFQYLPLR